MKIENLSGNKLDVVVGLFVGFYITSLPFQYNIELGFTSRSVSFLFSIILIPLLIKYAIDARLFLTKTIAPYFGFMCIVVYSALAFELSQRLEVYAFNILVSFLISMYLLRKSFLNFGYLYVLFFLISCVISIFFGDYYIGADGRYVFSNQNPNNFAFCLLVALSIMLTFFMSEHPVFSHPIKRFLIIAIGLFLIYLVVLTGTRFVIYGTIMVLLTCMFWFSKNQGFTSIANFTCVFLLSVLIGAILLNGPVIERVTDFDELETFLSVETGITVIVPDDSSLGLGGRVSSWKLVYDLSTADVFFNGIGYEQFRRHADVYGIPDPHNIIFDSWIIAGFLGFIFSIFLVTVIVWNIFNGFWFSSDLPLFIFPMVLLLALMFLNIFYLKEFWLLFAVFVSRLFKSSN